MYIRIAEWVWNPSRLDLDGEKPPVPQPIVKETVAVTERPARDEALRAFWTALLAYANARSNLHAAISATGVNWIGARRHGHSWNYVVLQTQTRVELYIDGVAAADTKAVFDSLHGERDMVEAAFGGPLDWQRIDDKRASRISCTVPGGWVDERTWPAAIERAVDAMQRLYGALALRFDPE